VKSATLEPKRRDIKFGNGEDFGKATVCKKGKIPAKEDKQPFKIEYVYISL
jgi:hypothetical protein